MEKIPLAFNYPIVIISVVIAMFACSTSIELLKRSFMKNANSHLWLICSAVIMGLGIWSMHFTGMLAYKMELAVSYDGLLTISSILLAIISSLLSFWLLRFRKTSQRMLVLISLFMAIGICSMHFVGMHGMNLSANMMHDYRPVALAGVLAFSISYLSFLAFSRVKNRPYSLLHLPAALLMAAGVSATHYTAMASVTWIASESENHSIHSAVPNFVLNSDYMLMGIVVATFIFIAIMHSLLMMDKRKTEENMNSLAFHDNLTGLANRLQLTNHIDFGTGYSSLSLLNSLPIDIVKIDRSFINEMLLSWNASVLVKTIIEMGENLNFRLVAEGIEEINQLKLLIDKGCHYGQGYLFSPPLAVGKFEAWHRAKRTEEVS
ncbi:Phytochrome-like protein cph2 [Planococcus massiliensis]|uniref:Phytochrome-like protein cph2 n=1 Tax=Planococcus massiliensis TaxID=1499687 RepID=A0A098EKD8_9BACL|nr:MHYT domain-containing protein [Planococcus massiliensis]CEG22834.1 Phytochrome-like protein cph2 [Planococcus massiliensis]